MSAASPTGRLAAEAAVLALASAAFYAWLSARPEYIGNISDTAVYLTMADFLSPWRDAPHAIGPSMFYDYSYPPLFPFALALLGGGSEHPIASYLAASVMSGAAVGAVYAWLRTLEVVRVPAAALTIAFALLPATLLSAMGLQSEPLYAALVFAGLACWNLRASTGAAAPAGALLIGLSVLARTVGISAVAAVLVNVALDPGLRRRLLLPALAIAPAAAWFLFRLAAGMHDSYADSVRHDTLAGTLGFLATQAASNPPAMWEGLLRGFDLLGTPHARALVAVFTALFAFTWLRRLRRLEPDAIYLLCYLAIILVWPFPNHMRRFFQVLMPVYLYYVYSGGSSLAAFLPTTGIRRAVTAGVLAFPVIAMAPSTIAMIGQVDAAEGTEAENFVRTPQWYMYDSPLRATTVMDRVSQVLEAMRGIDEHLPEDACVSSPIYAYIPLYGRRRAFAVPGSRVSDDAFEAQLSRCPYVFMMAGTVWPPSDFPSMYPHERIKDRLEVIEVSLWDRTASSGTVLTMLAKVDDAPPASDPD